MEEHNHLNIEKNIEEVTYLKTKIEQLVIIVQEANKSLLKLSLLKPSLLSKIEEIVEINQNILKR